jgi:hypothetical protein
MDFLAAEFAGSNDLAEVEGSLDQITTFSFSESISVFTTYPQLQRTENPGLD